MNNTLDLFKNSYDRETLKKHLYELDLLDILQTQYLDASFVVKYIMNPKYDLDDRYNFTTDMVISYQPHIQRHDIVKELIFYDSDNDSVEDFETVSNK